LRWVADCYRAWVCWIANTMIRVIAELAISRAVVHQLGKATTAPTTSQITTAAGDHRPRAVGRRAVTRPASPETSQGAGR